MGIAFLKGHGTQNDFVLLPDPEGLLDVTPERVQALCDRRRGLGADGVLRVVRRDALTDAGTTDTAAIGGAVQNSRGEWFMDYRNADGSLAEMCGNGVRVFARYLLDAGLVAADARARADGEDQGHTAPFDGSAEFVIGSRAGDRAVRVHPDGAVTVDMGPARVAGESMVSVAGLALPGIAVDVGNPHLVCRVDTDVAELDLGTEPAYDPRFFPNGANLEFINEVGADTVRMRVLERGVGETRACGTGTVAAVAATLHHTGEQRGSRTVHMPGGAVEVTVEHGASTLTGPAVILASGELDRSWWDAPE